VQANQTTTVDFALEREAAALEEMVVVGYGEQQREDLIGSVSSVSGEDLEEAATSNPMEMLQGKNSGVYVAQGSGEPGSQPDVVIRGQGSVSAGTDPLYVIDGIISEDYNSLNTSNIASINVLKGPTATAIYGSRASGGVVVITTEQGKSGETRVEANLSSSVATALQGNLDLMNAQQLYSFYQQMNAPIPDGVSQGDMTNTNWREEMFSPAVIQKYNVSVSGGTNDTRIYTSGSYFTDDGTLRSTGYDRFGGRVNVSHQVTDRFELNTKLFGQYERHENDPTGVNLQAAHLALPWDSPDGPNGEPARKTLGQNWLSRDPQFNPIYAQQLNFDRSRNTSLSANAELSYDVTDWLSLTSTNNVDFSFDRGSSYGDPATSAGASNDGELFKSSYYSSLLTTSNLARANRTLGKHFLKGILGFELQRFQENNSNATGSGIDGFDVLSLAANPYGIGGFKNAYSFLSGFTQVRYNYADRYSLTGSFRLDGSSRFGENNRFGNFYSIGGSWTLSEEAFFEESILDFFNQLKLRLGYGTTGNAQIGNYAAQSLQSYDISYNGQAGSYPSTLGNLELTWEKQTNLNVGLNAQLFEGRISLTVDAYQKKAKDLLQAVPLPFESGFTEQLQNVGTVRNRGVEVSLSTVNLAGSLRWTTDFNFGLNRNKVIDLYEGREIIGSAGYTGQYIIEEGSPLRTWYMRKWAGVDPENGNPLWEKVTRDENGNVVDVTTTSNYNEATVQSLGDPVPDLTGGFSNSLTYKGLSLSFLLNFAQGNQVYSRIMESVRSDGGYPTSNQLVLPDGYSRWQEPGDQATEPKPVYGGNNFSYQESSRFLMDGSYLRLKNARLGYRLPETLTQRFGTEMARVYVSGSNLWTLTTSDYIGPDPAQFVNGYQDWDKYPVNRTVSLGLDFRF